MLVRDVMTKNPITIDIKASVREAHDLLKKNNINKLPVVDKSGALVGIITSNDLQRTSPSEATTLDMYELSYLLSKLTVEKTMVKNVITVEETETVEYAAKKMADGDFGCLPVMKDKILVGIITDSDLFKIFINMFETNVPSVRAVVTMADASGALAKFSQKIADANGNIVTCVATDADNPKDRKVTIKVTGLKLDTFKQICESCGTVSDIREV